MIPVSDEQSRARIESMKSLILSEVNIKAIEYITEDNKILVKKIKPNFKTLGPRFGKLMKAIAAAVMQFEQHQIHAIEANGSYQIELDGQNLELNLSDVEIFTEDIPGWVVTNLGNLTVALDITISEELHNEGIARELVNRIQNIRKDKGFEVTDTIRLLVEKRNGLDAAININSSYICSETLAESLELSDSINDSEAVQVELTDDLTTSILISKS